MNRNTRYWVRRGLMILMAGMIGFALYQPVEGTKEKGPVVGSQAPDFQLETLDGKSLRLSDLRGKGVLVNFWATWCKPCREEMPAIQKMYEKYRDRGFEVVAVNIAETPVAVQGFTRQLGLTFPVVLDRDRQVTKLYQVGPIPTSFFVRPNGTIAHKVVGQMDEGQIEIYINDVIPE